MRRPLLLFCFCLTVLVAVWYHFGDVSAGGGPPDGTGVVVTGRVLQKDETSIVIKIQNAAILRQENPTINSNKTLEAEKLLCEYDSAEESILGSAVLVQGDFYAFTGATNPGEFDYARYYCALGYAGRLKNTVLLESETGGVGVRERLYRLRCFWEERLYRIFPEKEASIMTAILLGDKSGLDEEIKELYQRGGIIHILSISGLHITFIGMGIYKLLRKMGAPTSAASAVGGAVLILYGIMTGLGVSVCRAIGMYLLRMLAQVVGRTYDMLTAMGVTAVLMLLYRPAWMGHMGFLLSFGSILGVGALLPVLTKRGEEEKIEPELYVESRWRRRFLKWREILWEGLRQSFWAGFSITVTTLPIQLWFSFEIPVYSILLNILVLPLMSVVMTVGFIAMAIPGLGVAGAADIAILSAYEWLCRMFEKLPCTMWNPGRPGIWQIAVYYLLWAAAVWGAEWMRGRSAEVKSKCVARYSVWICRARPARLLLLGTAVLMIAFSPCRGDRITFLDVGQGDGICVQLSSGEVYLFDCGSSSRSHIGEKVLLPFLKYHGIRRVDAIFLSHADADHVNGALELLELYEKERISVGQIVLPGIDRKLWQEEFGEILEAAGEQIPVTVIRAGESWSAGEDSFLCLHPSSRGDGMGDNGGSECFYIELKEGENRLSLLFTGDVEGAGEAELLAELRDRQIRDVMIYKVAHHGSKNSTSAELLEHIRPSLSIISCGRNNRYGHPHPELLNRLEQAGSIILQTSESGAVTVRIRGGKVSVEGFLR